MSMIHPYRCPFILLGLLLCLLGPFHSNRVLFPPYWGPLFIILGATFILMEDPFILMDTFSPFKYKQSSQFQLVKVKL